MAQSYRLLIEKEIKNLKNYVNFIFMTFLLNTIFGIIFFQIDSIMGLTEDDSEYRGSDSETEETKSEDAYRFNKKGIDLIDVGSYQKAIKYYDMALDKDPNCNAAVEWKINAQGKLENYNNAEKNTMSYTIYDSTENIKEQKTFDLNNPPVANNASITTSMNQPIDIQLLASDKDNNDLKY